MIYLIRHKIEYRYSEPVYLDPHLLHFMPRSDASQVLKYFSLQVQPEPLILCEITDALGNPAHEVFFKKPAKRLFFEASCQVEVLRQNPFDYLLRSSSLRLPARYPPALTQVLSPYRQAPEEAGLVAEFAHALASFTGYETITFLSELCLEIHRRIRHVRRDEGFPWPPEKTLAEGKGACRDLAVLFMACCLSQGLAARFTSGYTDGSPGLNGVELHAWAEVYLEGAGWRGYDPTTGMAVCEQYVAVASSPDPRLVTPVIGTFRTEHPVGSKMEVEVSMRPMDPESSSTETPALDRA